MLLIKVFEAFSGLELPAGTLITSKKPASRRLVHRLGLSSCDVSVSPTILALLIEKPSTNLEDSGGGASFQFQARFSH